MFPDKRLGRDADGFIAKSAMLIAFRRREEHDRVMHEQRILELEQQLAAAKHSLVTLTQTNGEFTQQLADAQNRRG